MPDAPSPARAYAKLNLMLSVGPPEGPERPRPGFHPIASWFHAIDLHDDVLVTPAAPGSPLTLDVAWAPDAPRPTPIDWPPEKDLTFRAWLALEAHVGRPLPAHISVRKRIPVGGGLGGGSSDAAAVLAAGNAIFSLNLDAATLRQLSAPLGSDIAFFLDDSADQPPRPALVTGLGDEVERLPRARGEVVLIIPPFGCATPDVYRAYDAVLAEDARARSLEWAAQAARREAAGHARGREPGPHAPKLDVIRRRVARQEGKADNEALFNELARAAFRAQPALGPLVSALARVTRTSAHVTGSGSAIFIVTSRPAEVAARVARVAGEAGCAVVTTRLV